MKECKPWGSEDSVKDGYIKGKQRYKCKDCARTYREGDLRQKYSAEQKMRVLKMYMEGMGIRSIERLEGVSDPLIITSTAFKDLVSATDLKKVYRYGVGN